MHTTGRLGRGFFASVFIFSVYAQAGNGEPSVNDSIRPPDAHAETAGTADAAVPEKTDPSPENDSFNPDFIVVKETLDTVFIFDKKIFKHIAKDWRRNIDILRVRGYGLSGSTIYGVHAVQTKPIENLIDRHLPGRSFDMRRFGFEPYIVSGGLGYIGLGDGFRLGGGGLSGEHRFFCENSATEPELVLSSRISYGGFLIEKAIVKNKWNFNFGGLIGAGSNKVVIAENSNEDIFSGISAFNDWKDRENAFDNPTFQAAYLLIEPHCGFSYTFFYFFHFGANVSFPTFMQIEKFSPVTEDYVTINPGLHINLIFGNLG